MLSIRAPEGVSGAEKLTLQLWDVQVMWRASTFGSVWSLTHSQTIPAMLGGKFFTSSAMYGVGSAFKHLQSKFRVKLNSSFTFALKCCSILTAAKTNTDGLISVAAKIILQNQTWNSRNVESVTYDGEKRINVNSGWVNTNKPLLKCFFVGKYMTTGQCFVWNQTIKLAGKRKSFQLL